MNLVWNNSVVEIMEPLCNILRLTYNYLYSLYDHLQNEDLSVFPFKAPGDYNGAPVIRTFQPGDTMQIFPITIVDDVALETSELFDISLSSSDPSARLGPDATVLIIEDCKST